MLDTFLGSLALFTFDAAPLKELFGLILVVFLAATLLMIFLKKPFFISVESPSFDGLGFVIWISRLLVRGCPDLR